MFKDYLKKTYPVYLLYLLFVLCTFVVLMICQMISDFEIFLEDDYWIDYVAYVKNYEGDYIINIDGKEYKIEI